MRLFDGAVLFAVLGLGTPARGGPPLPQLYAPSQALSDATSGPLTLVGIGGWPGLFGRLSCVYRNDRVFVVDEKCSTPETNQLVAHVLSPTLGKVSFSATASAPVSSLRRSGYASFSVASAPPRPAPLALAMTYEELLAQQTDPPGRILVFCSAGTGRPEGHCTSGAPIPPAAYAAEQAPLLADPPEAWYELVRALLTQRKLAHATLRPGALPPPRLAAWALSWARDHDCSVAAERLKQVGNTAGLFTPIAATADGGAILFGLREVGKTAYGAADVPVAVRFDASARVRWERPLPDKGFVDHEDASGIVTSDGALVLAAAYPSPSAVPVYRLVKLDARGKQVWQWLGRGQRGIRRPQVTSAQLTPGGAVLLAGHIQLAADGEVHSWLGEVDARGQLVRDEVGPAQPHR